MLSNLLRHDYAKPHAAAKTLDFSSFHSDLAPNDFVLFPKISDSLRSKTFFYANAVVKEFRHLFEKISKK